MAIQSRVHYTSGNPKILTMSKPNEPKLRNKSLLAMCELLKLGQSDTSAASFLRILAPVWPGSRQILYDLFSHADIWIEAVFSNRYLNDTHNIIEIKLVLSIYPDKYKEYCNMVKLWPKGDANDVPQNDNDFGSHRLGTNKRFCTQDGAINYVKKNLKIVQIIHFWYVHK